MLFIPDKTADKEYNNILLECFDSLSSTMTTSEFMGFEMRKEKLNIYFILFMPIFRISIHEVRK